MQDRRTLGLANQLYEAVGSISANIAEGYSRGTGKDRARFYEYSLGSARESRDWYFKGRHILDEQITNHRFGLLVQIIRLLLTMVPEQRGRILRESGESYLAESDARAPSPIADAPDFSDLLSAIPFPD
jgi:four helix bundle protein